MAISLTTTQPDFIDGDVWIHISEAAKALGMHEGSLRRNCQAMAEMALNAGTLPDAKQMTPAAGGKATWFIRRSYHPDLHVSTAHVRLHKEPTEALLQVPEKKRTGATNRVECVKQYRAWRDREKRPMKDWFPELQASLRRQFPDLGVSRTRLFDWAKHYEFPEDAVKLIDGRGGDSSVPPDAEAIEFFRKRFLGTKSNRAECWRATQEEAQLRGWRWTALSTLNNCFRKYVTEDDENKHRNPTLHHNRFAPYMQIDPESQEVGVVWLGDHSQMDFWVRFQGRIIRPWVTVWIDWRSRRVCGWVMSESPNSSTIMASLRAGILDPINRGGPAVCYIDNGKDYDAWFLQGETKKERRARARADEQAEEGIPGMKGLTAGDKGLFGLLDIECAHTNPYAARSKGRCERWFGTMHDHFDKAWPTYCGRSPENKPDGLDEWMEANANLIPSFEDARAAFAEHVQGYNLSAEHNKKDMIGMSPDQMYAQRCAVERRVVDPVVLDLLLQKWMRTVTVTQNGITIFPFGKAMIYGQRDRWLDKYKALKAKDRPELRVSYDPDEMETLRVWTVDWKLLGTAELNEFASFAPGTHLQETTVRDVIAETRRAAKTEKAAREARNLRYTSSAQRLARKQYANDNPPPPPAAADAIRLVQTPVDGAVKDFKRHKVKQAVGADVLGLDGPAHPIEQLKPRSMLAELGNGQDVFGDLTGDDDAPVSWANFGTAPTRED